MPHQREKIKYGEYIEHRDDISGWICTKCKRYWGKDKHMASYCCCTTRDCESCGGDIGSKHYLKCSACRRAENDAKFDKKLAEAELVEWDGGMICSEQVRGYRDGYWASPEDLEEYCQDEEIEVPEFAFACRASVATLSVEDILEQAESAIEWYDEFGDINYNGLWNDEFGDINYNGLDEFRAAVEKFNEANKDVRVYFADYSRKVRVL